MGLVRIKSQSSYWETYISYDGVSLVMERNMFKTILRNIHFVNNLEIAEEGKANDCIWKLRMWITELRKIFPKVSPDFLTITSLIKKTLILSDKIKKLSNISFKTNGSACINPLKLYIIKQQYDIDLVF